MKEIITALTYERVSTEDQTKSKSIEDQKSINDRHINENGWLLASNGNYKDEGISGTKLDRPGLQDLLIRCEKDKEIDVVVVTETDRLARGNFSFIQVRELLKKLGVKIVAVTQPMVDDSDEGEMIGEILGAVNGLFPKITRRKSMRASDEKAKRGWYPSKAPIGYKNINKGTEEHPNRIIEINDDESSYIKLIPTLYNEGKSYVEIADYLFNLGLRGRQNGKVSPNEIRLIIHNDFYLGEFDWRGIRYKGNHPPLFNKFDIIQARNRSAEKNHIHSTENLREEFAFKRLNFYCKDCNCRITAHKRIKYYARTDRHAEYVFYHCTKSKGGWKNCTQPTINKESLIQEFADKAVSPISLNKELATFLFEELNSQASFHAEEKKKLLQATTRRLGQLDNELRNLFELYISRRLPSLENKTQDEIYEEFRFKKELEREKLITTQRKLQEDTKDWVSKASNFFSLCIDAKNRFLRASEEKQVNFLRIVTSNVLLDNKKLVISHQFPFSELLNLSISTSVLRD